MDTLTAPIAAGTQNAQSQSTAPAALPAASATAGEAEPVISSDFETFLVMLTAQIENQDPLNPIESSDFAVQLATFAGVEQQLLTNQLLQDLNAAEELGGLTAFSGWIGREARHSGPVSFIGDPVELALDLPAGAESHYLSIKTTDGFELGQEKIPGSGTPEAVEWYGLSPNGSPLLPGDYILETVSVSADGIETRRPVSSYGVVTEVRDGPTGIEVVLAGGQAMAPEEVSGLRLPW